MPRCQSAVEETRKDLFATRNKIPPTKDVLLRYSQQALFQAGMWCELPALTLAEVLSVSPSHIKYILLFSS